MRHVGTGMFSVLLLRVCVWGGGATANEFTMKNTGFYFRWQLHQAVLSRQHNKGISFTHRTLHPVNFQNETPHEIKYFKTVNE